MEHGIKCVCGAEHSIYCMQCAERRTFTAKTIDQAFDVYRCACDTIYVVSLHGHEEQREKPSDSIMNIFLQTRDYLMDKIARIESAKGDSAHTFLAEAMRKADNEMKAKWAKLEVAKKANDFTTVTSLCRAILQGYRHHLKW